ncbi:MAG: cobalamin B12-binding domain-containing protein [Parcubacteria group bacterium]|nr:cobalamin B12-binding domain-containing protein [Parcubacteria group bacterium]
MKKVTLFFPTPFPYFRPWKGVPLSLLAISRVLDKQGYKIKIISRFLSDTPEKEILKEMKDSVCLGISAMTGFQIYDGLKIAHLVKKAYPKIPIVWGGWHPSILPKQTLKDKNVDIVVVGQGDRTFPELVEVLRKGKSLKDVHGIVYKQNGKIITNLPRPLEDINNLPPLPYHLVDIEKCIFGTEYGERTIPYISSYGCPYHCGFCVEQIVNKRKWVAVKAEKVVEEWQDLVKKYNADSIAVYDSNFFVNKERVYDICQGLLKKKVKIKWGNANGRVPQLAKYEPEIWQAMEKSGCSMILTGAESGSQEALDFIDKDMNVEEIAKFTNLCKKYHIKILYSFLVGLPWSKSPKENKKFIDQEYDSTLSLIDRLLKISDRNRFTYYIFLPYPGAPLFKRAVNLGLKTPRTLNEWSTYLMSPEDAFKTSVRQRWITPKQARLTAMLTQYIFGLMDQDTYDVLRLRASAGIKRTIFVLAYRIGLVLVKLRWRFKFFDFPVDYWFFTLVHKYSGLI